MFLSENHVREAEDFFKKIVDVGMQFKLQDTVTRHHFDVAASIKLLEDLPTEGEHLDQVLAEFERSVAPYCTNFASKKFMGFPDAGNSVASIGASILVDFFQQNLINQSFCSPSGTLIECTVIRWLRQTVGYSCDAVNDIWDVGGIITPGGTTSNCIGILLAREHRFPGSMNEGIFDPSACKIVVPKGIGHYSVKGAQMWLGCGNRLIEVETDGFRYNLDSLKHALIEHQGMIMCVVAYAGDSRTMTVDRLQDIALLVKSIDPSIWLHVDACHGFSLGFSDTLRHKIAGIEEFDSIAMDPHKVLNTPYVISALLVKDPSVMKTVTSMSDLIMKEQFAFGQITPFLGSRRWDSLKLWFVMKNLGKQGLDRLIEARHELARFLSSTLSGDQDFIVLNEVEINAVLFFYRGSIDMRDIEELNRVNQEIHRYIIAEGKYHLHQFSIPDQGVLQKGALLYPHRFMCGNPNTTRSDVLEMIEYIRIIGQNLTTQQGACQYA